MIPMVGRQDRPHRRLRHRALAHPRDQPAGHGTACPGRSRSLVVLLLGGAGRLPQRPAGRGGADRLLHRHPRHRHHALRASRCGTPTAARSSARCRMASSRSTRRRLFGMPITGFYVLALAIVLWIVLEHLPIGRHVYAIGANPQGGGAERHPGAALHHRRLRRLRHADRRLRRRASSPRSCASARRTSASSTCCRRWSAPSSARRRSSRAASTSGARWSASPSSPSASPASSSSAARSSSSRCSTARRWSSRSASPATPQRASRGAGDARDLPDARAAARTTAADSRRHSRGAGLTSHVRPARSSWRTRRRVACAGGSASAAILALSDAARRRPRRVIADRPTGRAGDLGRPDHRPEGAAGKTIIYVAGDQRTAAPGRLATAPRKRRRRSAGTSACSTARVGSPAAHRRADPGDRAQARRRSSSARSTPSSRAPLHRAGGRGGHQGRRLACRRASPARSTASPACSPTSPPIRSRSPRPPADLRGGRFRRQGRRHHLHRLDLRDRHREERRDGGGDQGVQPAARCWSIEDTPIGELPNRMAQLTTSLLQRYGDKWTYSLAVNDLYYDFAAPSLQSAGIDPAKAYPRNISAGDGSRVGLPAHPRRASTRSRRWPSRCTCTAGRLIDELNRAFAGEAPSGYVAAVASRHRGQHRQRRRRRTTSSTRATAIATQYKKIWGVE